MEVATATALSKLTGNNDVCQLTCYRSRGYKKAVDHEDWATVEITCVTLRQHHITVMRDSQENRLACLEASAAILRLSWRDAASLALLLDSNMTMAKSVSACRHSSIHVNITVVVSAISGIIIITLLPLSSVTLLLLLIMNIATTTHILAKY